MDFNEYIDELKVLAEYFPKELYAVGGFVRDGLAGLRFHDVDIAADVSPDEVFAALKNSPFTVKETSKKLMTLKIIGKGEYEYTAFRVDSYTDGHSPTEVKRTSDMYFDALRRDFTANAVYMEIKSGVFCDPLGGIADIKSKVLRMTREQTFKEDGLRLMRLCRQAAELGFSIEKDTLESAKKNSFRIEEISPERIREELSRILVADTRYGVADAHYRGLKLLDEIGVLEKILPEITVGKGMEQRKDFHKYDVFNHILQTVRLADPKVRLAALLHDIGKPYCMINYGKYSKHAAEGEKLAENFLRKYRYSNDEIRETLFLVGQHMFDLRGERTEEDVRLFLQKNYLYLDKLFLLKDADFKASGVVPGECPALIRHGRILKEMRKDGVPFSLSELKINGSDLEEMGVKGCKIGDLLQKLFTACALRKDLKTREAQMEFIIKERKNAD